MSTDRYVQANPVKVAATNASWRLRNPVKSATVKSTWLKANPQRSIDYWQNRRARKCKATVPGQAVTAAVIAERLALFDGCAYCDADEKLTVDHFVALNNGGLHVASNLVGACKTCNSSKKDKPVEEWFKSQLFYSEQRWQVLFEVTAMSQERLHSQKNNSEE